MDTAEHAPPHFIGVVKGNSSRRYPKAFLQETMKDWPAGSHLVLKTSFNERVVFAMVYKYCKKKVINFIFTEGAAHTECRPDYAYEGGPTSEKGDF